MLDAIMMGTGAVPVVGGRSWMVRDWGSVGTACDIFRLGLRWGGGVGWGDGDGLGLLEYEVGCEVFGMARDGEWVGRIVRWLTGMREMTEAGYEKAFSGWVRVESKHRKNNGC